MKVLNTLKMFMIFKVYLFQVFLVRKIVGKDVGTLYAMKVLKKATLKGRKSPF